MVHPLIGSYGKNLELVENWKSKNYFMYPLSDKRKVYVFSDAPNLIKTVRNRLHNNKYLKV